MERNPTKYCNRCKKSIPELTYLLHEKFCEHIPLEEYKHCEICDCYMDEKEFDDHMYCHKLDKEFNNGENNFGLKSKNSFDIEKNYELVDKEQVVKDIQEQEIFEKKFAEIKNKKNTRKSNTFLKKIIPYLFYCDNRYKLPRSLIILLGIFVEPALLVNFCLVELIDFWLGRARQDQETDENLLELIPETTITDPEKLPDEKKSCIICLGDYEAGENILSLSCTHAFHTNCIRDWLNSQNHCPICKHEIKKEDYQP